MILQEVFRRAESDNRTLGHFLEENVFRKLGVGVHMGLRPEDQERLKIVNVESLSAEQVETCTRSCIKYHTISMLTGSRGCCGCWQGRCSQDADKVHQLQQRD